MYYIHKFYETRDLVQLFQCDLCDSPSWKSTLRPTRDGENRKTWISGFVGAAVILFCCGPIWKCSSSKLFLWQRFSRRSHANRWKKYDHADKMFPSIPRRVTFKWVKIAQKYAERTTILVFPKFIVIIDNGCYDAQNTSGKFINVDEPFEILHVWQ